MFRTSCLPLTHFSVPKSLHEVDMGREYDMKSFISFNIYTYVYHTFCINKISSPFLVLLEDLLSKIHVHLSIHSPCMWTNWRPFLTVGPLKVPKRVVSWFLFSVNEIELLFYISYTRCSDDISMKTPKLHLARSVANLQI